MTSWINLLALSVIASAQFSLGAVYDNVADLPKTSYDFVIVGASPAGSVVANRLTENSKFSVLLLEAGGLTANNINSQVPGYASRAQASLTWNFTSTPMTSANNRSIKVLRGFGLGGSTAINGMLYTRGSKEDWDRYASVSGDAGWSWDNIQQYLRKNEKWSEPADGHNSSGQFDPQVHSLTGINSVSLAGYVPPSNEVTIAAINEQNNTSPFKFNLDYNSGDPLGMGYTQSTITSKGRRSSAAVSYLADEYVARPNFDILLNARVTRLLPADSTKDPLQFGKVEFSDGTETLQIVSASKEVILSAGGIMSSHILLHSGIGPAAELSGLGITPVHDLPQVGKNLADHSFVFLSWSKPSTSNQTIVPPTDEELFEQWQAGSGPLTDIPVTHLGWTRLGDAKEIKLRYNLTEDPAPGEQSPHIELIFLYGGGFNANDSTPSTVSVTVNVLTPTSRKSRFQTLTRFCGFITINSTNPLDAPLIDMNLVGSAFDMAAMRDAVCLTYQFFNSPAWEGFSPMALDVADDVALDQYVKNGVSTSYHAIGTTRMSKDSSSGVVSSDLRVNGARGLRVVDIGVLPYLPAAHTQVAAYVVGERAADLIKAAWK